MLFFPISADLMQKLVSSSDLFVMHTEFSIYVLLRFWVFLQLHPKWDSPSQESILEAQRYFHNREGEITVTLCYTRTSLFNEFPGELHYCVKCFTT
jgi:hypothetical protein